MCVLCMCFESTTTTIEKIVNTSKYRAPKKGVAFKVNLKGKHLNTKWWQFMRGAIQS